jgi:predicted patatin/cPLA2 family phospholipase
MIEIYDELIISSGGIKGISLIGGLERLSKNYPINKIKYYTGCSFGSIILLLLNINYTINEIKNIFLKINFGNFQECKIINFFEKCGLDEGLKFMDFLRATMINKNYNFNITFKELYELTNKILTIAVVNITKGTVEYQNYITTPNLSVILSVRMSSGIPLLFSPVLYNNFYYVDGALLDPFPYFYNKKTRKIGLWLFDKCEFDFIKNSCSNFITDLSNSFKYILDLLKIMYTNYMKKYYKKIPKNIIYITYDMNLSFDTFDISIIDKMKMYNIGIKKTNIHFKKLKKKRRKLYLLKKYFNLWSRVGNPGSPTTPPFRQYCLDSIV